MIRDLGRMVGKSLVRRNVNLAIERARYEILHGNRKVNGACPSVNVPRQKKTNHEPPYLMNST